MKSADFAERLEQYTVTLPKAAKRGVAPALKKLAKAFRGHGDVSVYKLLKDKKLGDDGGEQRCNDENLMATNIIGAVRQSLPTADRKSAGKDFSALMKIADQRPGLSISAFVETVLASLASPETPRKQASPKMNLQKVEQLVRDLEATFKDPEAFASVFETLKSADVRREEAVEIASRFMGKTAKSASKQTALKRIWARHASLMDNRAKRKAFGGRTAA